MEKTNDGGPAFPMCKVTVLAEDGTQNEACGLAHDGMTLRDYFAAKAMHAILEEDLFVGARELARLAYKAADAMIKERAND